MVGEITNGRNRDYSAEWLQLLVESALDAVVTMDSSGRIIAFNPAAEKIFRVTKEKAIGHMVTDQLIPVEYRQAHEKGLRRFLMTGQKRIAGERIQASAKRADGTLFPAEIEIITVNPSKSPVFMAYIRDISERVEALQERIQHARYMQKTLLQTIMAVSKIIEIRDPYTAGHQKRVAHLAASIAEILGFSGNRLEGLYLGALIHDIGKIAIPGEILSRPGHLQDEDRIYLKTHCLKGYEILKPINFPWPVADIALQHHEHLDGSGYPQGLHDPDILMEAKIVAIADVVEALISHRPYRPAKPLKNVLFFISSKSGEWFDEQAAAVCTELFRRGYRLDSTDPDRFS